MIRHFDAPDGTRLAYRDEGRGLPVLCLSGLTRNGTDFDYVAPHLADTRLVRLDYRGRGASAWADPASYTPAVEAGDALALLDHLGLQRAAVLGTSRGGLISMLLAATAKPRLIGVCLVDIGPELNLAGLEVIRGYVGKTPANRPLEELAVARARMLQGFANVPESRWLEEVTRHFVVRDGRVALNYDPELRQVFDRAGDADPVDMWPFFDAFAGLPLALVRGANSDLLSAATATEMRRRRPDMIFADVPDRGHVPFLDEPEAVAAIRDWLAACEAAAAEAAKGKR